MGVRFRNPKEERESALQKRLLIFTLALCLGYTVVVGRAVHLMLKDNRQLEALAMSQYRAAIQKETERSRILDTHGYELAISLPTWSLYADPKMVEDPSRTAAQLSNILGLPREKIFQKLKDRKRFVWLERRANARTMAKIRELSLKGIDAFKENTRFYPQGELAGSVLGAVGIDSQALGGVELAYDRYLMIPPSASVYLRDARGELVSPSQPSEELQGKGDVTLTLDKNIQFFAEQALKSAVDLHRPAAGVVIVMEPATGKILAMASYPFFNPNHFEKAAWGAWRSRAVTDVYEPGSTFKTFIVAAALEAKKISLREKFDCEGGSLSLPDGEVIHDHRPYGLLDVPGIIKVSSNIGIYKISRRLNKRALTEKIMAFGFGSKTRIDFPGESAGIVKAVERLRPIEQATIAFGYGVGVTPLQLVSAYGAVANGGARMRPHLVEKAVSPDGEILYEAFPEILSRPISPETAETLTQILKGVVEEGGTATLAAVNAYTVAGKTGTARKVAPDRRGYLEGEYISSFVGFAPADAPRLVTLVLLDSPRGSFYGGQAAAPVFQEVMHRSLHYLGVPTPGHEKEIVAAADAKPRLSPAALTPEGKFFKVPDFTGASMREVLQAAGPYPVEIVFRGGGGAVRQAPPAGDLVSTGGKIFVEFAPLY